MTGKNKSTEMTVLFSPLLRSVFFSFVILGQAQRVPGIFGHSDHTLSVTLLLDVRGKPEHDRKNKSTAMTILFFLCLTFNIVAFLCDKNKGGSINGRQKNLYFH